MQEIKKRPIVLASVLKPLNDTRMLEKFGMSLSKTQDWDIHIIGFGKSPGSVHNMTYYPLGEFSRISLNRILAPWRVFMLLIRIKPIVVIINTHELLLVGCLFKAWRSCNLYYDVQENYSLNIRTTKAFPAIIRNMIASYVRMKELLSRPLIKHYLLAERCYQAELPFVQDKFTILENKCAIPDGFKRYVLPGGFKFLFSGTLDTTTGVFEAIELVKKLHEYQKDVTLRIIGYAALPAVQNQIIHEAEKHPFIKLVGIQQLVQHSEIFDAIAQSHAGIIYYPDAKHTRNKIPTKLYEYLACRLPIIYDATATWRDLPERNQAGIGISFSNPDPKTILSLLALHPFYPAPVPEATWQTEEPKFLQSIA